MEQRMEVTYLFHSGFCCEVGDILCIFDYWKGENEDLPEKYQITESKLTKYNEIYVFVSHSHPDHFDKVIYDWYKKYLPITYVVSFDLPVGSRGKRMNPGEEAKLSDRVSVKAFASTDLGVSFLVNIAGLSVFHAGDLNFWHWREESTTKEIMEAEEEFQNIIRTIEGEDISLAFFPVDPRQGHLFEAGANYFLLSCKPSLMIPMHFWKRSDIISKYARQATNKQSGVYAMTKPGEKIQLIYDNQKLRYIDVFDSDSTSNRKENPDNPFSDSDLPVKI